MLNIVKNFFLLSFFLYWPDPALAQVPSPDHTPPEVDSVQLSKKRHFILLPVLYRSPETGFATGLFSLTLLKMPGANPATTRTSNIELPLIYTQRHQVVVDLLYNLLFNNEDYIWRGVNAYNKFSELYYGIGNHIPEADKELVEFQLIRSTQRFLRRVHKRHFAGLQYQLYSLQKLKLKPGGQLESQHTHGFLTSGLGGVYLYDSRDNVINAARGWYVDVSTFAFLPWLGSQQRFTNLTVDVRHFIPLNHRCVLAGQVFLNFNQGEVPFRQMATLGGPFLMRGYYIGRFRDKNFLSYQMEYRFPIYKRLGATAFGAIGEVAGQLRELNLHYLHYSYGAGLRLLLHRAEKVNIRLDVGLGHHTSGVYLSVGEAF